MSQLRDKEFNNAIDWMRQARLCLESALTLLRHDPEAMPIAYHTRYISDDVNRLCRRIETVDQHRAVKAEGIGEGVLDAGGFSPAGECRFGLAAGGPTFASQN